MLLILKRVHIIRNLALIFLFLTVTASAKAEAIHLNDGNVVEGKIIEKNAKSIKVDVVGMTMTYYADEIKDIDGQPFVSQETTNQKEAPGVIQPQVENQSIDSQSKNSAITTQTTNPPAQEQQQYLEQIQTIIDKGKEDPQEAFNEARDLLNKMDSSSQSFPKVLFETFRLGAYIFPEKFLWDPKGAESYINDLDKIINQRGGFEKMIDVMRGYLQGNGISVQDWVNNSFGATYYFEGTLAAYQGKFEQAQGFLSQLEAVSFKDSKSLEKVIAMFQKFYTEEKSLLPLYQVLLGNGHDGELTLEAVHRLAPLIVALDFSNATQGQALENKLRQLKSILEHNVFTFDKTTNRITDVSVDHISIFVDLLGGKADSDLRSMADVISSNPSKLRGFRYLFACNYCTYLTYMILKSQGININSVETKHYDANFVNDSVWLRQGAEWGIIKPNIKRIGHYCNIVWLDSDHFVIVDMGNEYVSPVYSWQDDLLHIGNKNIFKKDNVFIKDFRITSPEETKSGLYYNFAGLFDNDLDRRINYYSQALILGKTADDMAGLGDAYYQKGDLKDAEWFAQKVLSLDSENALALLTLARIFFDQGKYYDAEQYAKRAIDADPDIGVSYHFLAKIYHDGFHDFDKTKEYLMKALRLYEQNENLDEVSEVKGILSSMQ